MTPDPYRSPPEDPLVDPIDQVLPQTQCTRCGYPDCRGYARAIAQGQANINQCPPGGHEGVLRLARVTGRPVLALNPDNGAEAPRTVVWIDENWCIGCTLCIKACPTDAIVGSHKTLHTVAEHWCTGCELCLPVCPVDCMHTEVVSGAATGWAAWSPLQAAEARERYTARTARLQRDHREHQHRLEKKAQEKLGDLASHSLHTDPAVLARKRTVIEAALARARERRQADEN